MSFLTTQPEELAAALNPATVTAAADAVPAAAAAAGLAHTVTPVGVGGASLTASLGEASSVGGLSVPAGWSTAAFVMATIPNAVFLGHAFAVLPLLMSGIDGLPAGR